MDFFPKSPKFFELFEELAKNVKLGGNNLSKVKIGSKTVTIYFRKTRRLEHAADNICHRLHYEADSTFITPIDREDIHILSKTLDNIIDLIENLTSNVILYNVTEEMKEFKDFAKKIDQATDKVFSLVSLLKYKGKHLIQMKKLIVEIHSLENEGDRLLQKAFSSLFANGQDAVMIIKWKDIFENMEEVLDECENTADIVSEIIVKNF